MSEQAVTEPIEFARARQSLSGSVAVENLERIRDFLASTGGRVDYIVTGFVDDNGWPSLHCEVRGLLKLRCLRCLEAMDFPLQLDTKLRLVMDESALEVDDPEAPDPVVAQPNMSLTALVEEEILLTLPMAPHHASGICATELKQNEPGTVHPFAALAQLKGNKR